MNIGWRLILFLAIIVAVVMIYGCAAVRSNDPPPIATQIKTVTVEVKTPVPCFNESEKPKMPEPTPIDLASASTEQKNAAMIRDAEALLIYAKSVDALFLRCTVIGEQK